MRGCYNGTLSKHLVCASIVAYLLAIVNILTYGLLTCPSLTHKSVLSNGRSSQELCSCEDKALQELCSCEDGVKRYNK